MVFFKHKYIIEPTVTPADQIIKVYQDPKTAIQGIPKSCGDAYMKALEHI